LLENIQRRAIKVVLYYPPVEVAYNNGLEQLDLLPLEMRRDTYDLVLLFKFKIGLVTANFDRFLVPAVHQYST